jgi:hypothetical protein
MRIFLAKAVVPQHYQLMQNPDYIGSAELAERVGVTMRTVQHWSDLGVILSSPNTRKQGRGKHREFSPDEVRWARVATSLHSFGVPVVWTRDILRRIRAMSPLPNTVYVWRDWPTDREWRVTSSVTPPDTPAFIRLDIGKLF